MQSKLGGPVSRLLGTMSDEQTTYETFLAAARGSALNALAGANVPPSEYERLADLIPTTGDELPQAKSKLRAFIQAMNIYSSQ